MVSLVRRTLGQSTSLILLYCLLLFTSCGDDDVANDNIEPSVSFRNLSNGADVWNTVPVDVEVFDNEGIEKVEMYIDGTLLGAITNPPYSIPWDTNTSSDGVHTIKVVVTDRTDNIAEASVSVTVKNVLVTLKIASGRLWSGERAFVFLSDENGKLITSVEYKDGDDPIELKKSDFSGTDFFLTEVHLFADNTTSLSYTYPLIERSKDWVISGYPPEPTSAGKATLNFSNAFGDAQYYMSTNGQWYNGVSATMPTLDMPLKTSPSKLYVTKYNKSTRVPTEYGLYSEIGVGLNDIDFNLVNRKITKSTIVLPKGVTDSYLEIRGTLTPDNFDEVYAIGSFHMEAGSESYSYYYPDSAFPTYYCSFFYETNEFMYRRKSTTAFYDFNTIPNDVSYTYSDNKFTYSANGEFDFWAANFEDEHNVWTFILPNGKSKVIPTLEIPASLHDITFPAFGIPVSHTVHDSNDMEGYEDFKNYVRQSPYGVESFSALEMQYTQMMYRNKSVGGRMRSKSCKSIFTLIDAN